MFFMCVFMALLFSISHCLKNPADRPASHYIGIALDVNMIIVCLILSRQTEDLEALETLTRISQRVISKLDPGYLDPLAEGSFGQVFRAKKGGRDVAVKILKNIESRKQIEDFEREVDTLRLV